MAISKPSHTDEHAHDDTHEHPGVRKYVEIAVILAILTSIEVAIYYIPALKSVLVPVLLVLSAIKFLIVIGYFMHLKFDNRLFAGIFLSGLGIGIGVVLSFLALFDRF